MSKYLFASLMTGIRLNIEDPTAADVREAVALARHPHQNQKPDTPGPQAMKAAHRRAISAVRRFFVCRGLK